MLESKSGVARGARAAAVALLLTMLSGCASFYVDTTLHDLTPSEKVVATNPQPVQLLFDFQTKGVHNGQGTDLVKSTVLSAVQNIGLFSQVGPDPVSNGAILSIVLNNIPLSDDAFAKGFATGLTFGIVGNTVGDGYICTIDYLPGANAPRITKIMRDAIYTSLGATADTPQHAQKVSSAKDAIETMTRQVVTNTLNEMAKDAGFNKASRMANK